MLSVEKIGGEWGPECVLLCHATASSLRKEVSFGRQRDRPIVAVACLRFGEKVTKMTSPLTTRKPKHRCPILMRMAWQPAMEDVVFR